ncbi:hypothetical protein AVEN_84599-1 [Araneus ventricosus]|uniref:Uncharacterized protein n=1 Tax=Araneus ventricosus TaxID=182803 RepID=A0A4Y2C134_ARAVE|nr:hypothetical protein AVEN_84599-1 [Araneus ventricosus]
MQYSDNRAYGLSEFPHCHLRPADGKSLRLATWLFTIGDICDWLTENRFALGDLARVWFRVGDICARLTENRFAWRHSSRLVHNWRHLRPANGKVPKYLHRIIDYIFSALWLCDAQVRACMFSSCI